MDVSRRQQKKSNSGKDTEEKYRMTIQQLFSNWEAPGWIRGGTYFVVLYEKCIIYFMQSHIRKIRPSTKSILVFTSTRICFWFIKTLSLRLYVFIWGGAERCTQHKGGLTTKKLENHHYTK